MSQRAFDIAVNEEIVNGKKVFVSHCLNLGIASQGNSYEEAIKNGRALSFEYPLLNISPQLAPARCPHGTTNRIAYGCSVPGLTRFTSSACMGPSDQRHL